MSGEAKGKRSGSKASPTQIKTLSSILHKLKLQWQNPETREAKETKRKMETEQERDELSSGFFNLTHNTSNRKREAEGADVWREV